MSNEKRKIYDLDAAFDKRIGDYMKKSKGKYTEEEWEDKIPELYQKFATTRIEGLGAAPCEYYARMSESELCQELKAHFEQGVAIDGFLRAAAEEEKNRSIMRSFLDGSDGSDSSDEEVLLAMQVLGTDDPVAVQKYVEMLCSAKPVSDKILGEIVELLSDPAIANTLCDALIAAYPNCSHKDCVESILSNVTKQSDAVFELLINAFRVSEESGRAAEYLAGYGDYRALPYLTERAQSEDCGYADWRSIKYAVESMGGSLPTRDFSADKDFIQYTNEEARIRAEQEEELK